MTLPATRAEFTTAVRDHFDRAGIEFAFLFAVESTDGKDPEVCVVVNHAHLAAVEAVVRSGVLGRLVQRLDQGIPWCCYVLATGNAERPFRHLEVASDLHGTSRYGFVLTRALNEAYSVNELPVLRSGWLVVYLAAQRAETGVVSIAEEQRLRQAFECDRHYAEALLVETWGRAGAVIGEALAEDRSLHPAFSLLATEISRSRRTPRRLALRGRIEARRIVGRLRRPAGLVVQLVGPDGAGKSTMAQILEGRLAGAFRRQERLHLGPRLLPSPSRLLGRASPDPSTPHDRVSNGRLGSYMRIAYLAADTLLGWVPRVWFPRVQTGLVLLERGWDDLRIDPVRYRLGNGVRLLRLLSHILPQPDLTILLTGNPSHIAERKSELPEAEIARQIVCWRHLLQTVRRFHAEVDTTRVDAAEVATTTVVRYLAERAGDLADFTLALECLGEPHAHGRLYSVVRAGGKTRWLLPRGLGAGGPLRVGLYRPASAKHEVGALSLDLAQKSGGIGLDILALDSQVGLMPDIAAAIGTHDVELGCLLPTDPSRPQRAVFSVLERGRPIAIAKVTKTGSPELTRERDVLNALTDVSLTALVPPKPLAFFTWRRYDVLMTSIVPTSGRTDRNLGRPERYALAELARVTQWLEPVLGAAPGHIVVHGDFSAWNSSRFSTRCLALWDWEWARLGLPLEDYFHWQTQRLVHFRRGTVDALVASALKPGLDVVRMCEAAGFDASAAPHGLAASLRSGLVSTDIGSTGHALRAEALRLLEGAA